MKGLRYFTPININGEYCTGSCVLQLNPSKVITDEKGGKQDEKKKKKKKETKTGKENQVSRKRWRGRRRADWKRIKIKDIAELPGNHRVLTAPVVGEQVR